MNRLILLKVLSLSLAMVAASALFAGAQTSLMEVRTTTSAMEHLDSASTGPSTQVLDRVRTDVGQPGSAPPAQQAPQVQQVPQAPAQPAVPIQPVGQTPDSMPSDAGQDVPSDEEGESQAFTLTAATQMANQGMAALRMQNFNQAVEAYRQAAENDPKYEKFYNVVVELRDRVNAGQMEQVRNERVHLNQVDLTWGQFLGWGGPAHQIQRYGYAPGLGGQQGPYAPYGGQMSPEMMMQYDPKNF